MMEVDVDALPYLDIIILGWIAIGHDIEKARRAAAATG